MSYCMCGCSEFKQSMYAYRYIRVRRTLKKKKKKFIYHIYSKTSLHELCFE